MKIKEIEIKDIGGIPYLKLNDINSQMNIICGANGVGKTNILECIASHFSMVVYSLRKRFGSDIGSVSLRILTERHAGNYKVVKTDIFEPTQSRDNSLSDYDPLPYTQFIYIKVNRVFDYKYLDGLMRAPKSKDHYEFKDPSEGVDTETLKSWFIHTHLLDGANDISGVESYNIEKARNFISVLDQSFSFNRTTRDFEIIVSTPSGEIFFEYLSSGFKSAFFILLGILKEIEYKHGKNSIPANEYDGVILIDEIELHLHPEWQSKIIKILKQEFPRAQFFITTHSPHVIQSAEYNEIIALDKRDALDQEVPFEVYQRELPASPEYGFQGWTIEEILTDVMGMKTTYGMAYSDQMDKFSRALDDKNRQAAQEAYDELEKMIHPSSHMRKMLKIQMAGFR